MSVGFGGAEAHGDSTTPAISGSGRFVAFASNATNLVAGGSAAGVFVYDRQTNVMERVGTGETPDISADGRYVTYRVQNPPSGSEIFVHDRQTHTDRLVSVGKNGGAGRGIAAEAVISADGHAVAFASTGNNLVAGDTNKQTDVFLRPLSTP